METEKSRQADRWIYYFGRKRSVVYNCKRKRKRKKKEKKKRPRPPPRNSGPLRPMRAAGRRTDAGGSAAHQLTAGYIPTTPDSFCVSSLYFCVMCPWAPPCVRLFINLFLFDSIFVEFDPFRQLFGPSRNLLDKIWENFTLKWIFISLLLVTSFHQPLPCATFRGI